MPEINVQVYAKFPPPWVISAEEVTRKLSVQF